MVPRFLWLNNNIPSLNCAFFNPQFKKSCTYIGQNTLRFHSKRTVKLNCTCEFKLSVFTQFNFTITLSKTLYDFTQFNFTITLCKTLYDFIQTGL